MLWLLSPLLPLILFVILTGIFLGLFVAGQRESAALRKMVVKLESRLDERLEAQAGIVAAVAQEVRELADMPRPTVATKVSMNLTRRHQVLRLARRGEPAAQIAATLQLPLREVELLLKMQKLASTK